MAWTRILGHEALAERFRESLATGRLSHAYLFVGPDGVGKELFARELTKALLCSDDNGAVRMAASAAPPSPRSMASATARC